MRAVQLGTFSHIWAQCFYVVKELTGQTRYRKIGLCIEQDIAAST